MSFAYGEIVWPNDGREANIVLRKFMLIALAAINYTFPEDLPSPINFVEKYISREIDQLECRKLAAQWRIQIPGLEGIRDFHSRDALSTRLAMLLLSIDESDDQEMMSEKLSWFMEFLQCDDENYKLVDKILTDYFVSYVCK
ncbi:hypothetical protein [Pseudomonas sp. KCJK9044]|uniref:hypothetical protein n=1 Tax=Pseudomonas sp. KCJK9044 TaxID=3344562 RepID=UPI003905F3C3